MKASTYRRLIAAADRLWSATYAADELRGDNVVSNRVALAVRNMIRTGEAESPTAVALLARRVERLLEDQREVA